MKKRAAWVLTTSLVFSPIIGWAQQNLSAQQAEAQKQRADLQGRIGRLQKEIESTQSSRNDVSSSLRDVESRISTTDRELANLDQRQKRVEQHLGQLQAQIKEQTKKQETGQALLAEQLRAQYASGLSPWTALLSGKDPQQIQRELGYLGYISQAQAQQVRELQQGLQHLQNLQQAEKKNKDELVQLSKDAAAQKQQLQAQQAERGQVLAGLEQQLRNQKNQSTQLHKNDQQLAQLITGLEKEIARQAELRRIAEERRKAEEARRLAEEKKRQEQARLLAEQQRAEQLRLQQEQQAQEQRLVQERAQQQQKDQEDLVALRQAQLDRDKQLAEQRADEERRWYALAHTPAQPAVAPPVVIQKAPDPAPAAEPVDGFTGLTRGLQPPVRGEVQGRFGTERPEGGPWRGIILRAPTGTAVQVVAAGRVVFANYMGGFGNLVIVDHGAGFLSVYGHNQSVLKQVGDIVRKGEAVARVGATGGQIEPGVYFEIRQNGKPVNPQLWLGN